MRHVLFILAVLVLAGPKAYAFELSKQPSTLPLQLATTERGITHPAAEAFMVVGRQTSQPIGHYEFCAKNPEECRIRSPKTAPITLTAKFQRLLRTTNIRVNQHVRPLKDIDIYGRDEVWAYPDQGVGDCEDYVLEKRRELNQSGVSLANLLITVVRKADGEGHAVLTVRTSEGDYILDNLEPRVLLWSETGYRFLKRQSSRNTGKWVTLYISANDLVSTVSTN